MIHFFPAVSTATRRFTVAIAAFVAMTALLGLGASPASAGVGPPADIYVDADATGANNGSSWDDAYIDLAFALAAAVDGDEIWVAEGTYTPGPVRPARFFITGSIDLFGGFDGTEFDRYGRNPSANVTTLSGDIGVIGDATDNSYHVIETSSSLANTTATIDGFTISGGYADGSDQDSGSSGIHHTYGSLVLADLIMTDNYADADGAALGYGGSAQDLTVTDSTFSNNTGAFAIHVNNLAGAGTILFSRVEVSDNAAGGIFTRNDATIRQSVIARNSSPNRSGLEVRNADVIVANTRIVANQGGRGAGLEVRTFSKDITVKLMNTVVANNRAVNQPGGGIAAEGAPASGYWAEVEVFNSTFANNVSAYDDGSALGSEVWVEDNGFVDFANSIASNPASNAGGAVYGPADGILWGNSLVGQSGGSAAWDPTYGIDVGGNIDADPLFADSVTGLTDRGNYRYLPGSPALDAGYVLALPGDSGDVDYDGNTSEKLPLDLDRGSRNDGAAPDLGAYENAYCGSTVYVDQDATGRGTGESWGNAFTEVRDLLDAIPQCDPFSLHSVWVADGLYTPTDGTDRSATFLLPGRWKFYGGFDGTETALSQRDFATNETVLSGEIGDAGTTSDNSYHVVTFENDYGVRRFDGFTVSGGNSEGLGGASARGAGVSVTGQATLVNLVVENNSSAENGGGVAFVNTASRLIRSTLRHNDAVGEGGSVYVSDVSIVDLDTLAVYENSAATGGGVAVASGGEIEMYSSTITKNVGGGLYTGGPLAAYVENSILWDNVPSSMVGTGTGDFFLSNIEGTGGSAAWNAGGHNDSGGNVDIDPGFFAAATDDYRLSFDSPLLDGTWPIGNRIDDYDVDNDGDSSESTPPLNGGERVVGSGADLGAYEGGFGDADGDLVGDAVDNCPNDSNASQTDTDLDGIGDACDPLTDTDADGVADASDNCVSDKNSDQADIDGDGIGDVCDPTDDRPVDPEPTPTPAPTPTPTPAPTPEPAANRIYVTNVIQSGPAEYDFLFGTVDVEILVGDWNGNGHDGFAIRVGRTISEYDERGKFIRTVTYGSTSDTIYRVGDWDGDGIDTLAVQRGNIFHITNSPDATGAVITIGYGKKGDEVFVGDWDGDGIDTFAVRRNNVFYVRNSVTSGPADVTFGYGRAGDEVLIGDWDTDGIDTFAVRRKNVIFIRNDFQTGVASSVIGYGKATDTLLVGDWNGDNVDTFAVKRSEK